MSSRVVRAAKIFVEFVESRRSKLSEFPQDVYDELRRAVAESSVEITDVDALAEDALRNAIRHGRGQDAIAFQTLLNMRKPQEPLVGLGQACASGTVSGTIAREVRNG